MIRLPEIDSAERTILVRIAVLGGCPVLLLLLIVETAFSPALLFLLIVPDLAITAAIVWLLWHAISGVGVVTRGLLMPEGIPPIRAFSEADALVMRGRIADAVALYRGLIVADPADLDARLRLGELLAGPAGDPSGAEAIFLETRALGTSAVQERILSNALIDLYRSTTRQDRLKAELARFARLNAGNRAGVQARRYLRRLTIDDATLPER